MTRRPTVHRRRRRLLTEARMLMRYVSDVQPAAWDCRLYVQALEQRAPGCESLNLPRLVQCFPRLLALSDDTAFPAQGTSGEGLRNVASLTGRLYVALAVAEARPRLAGSFLREAPSGKISALLALIRATAFEWLPLGLALARAVGRRILRP